MIIMICYFYYYEDSDDHDKDEDFAGCQLRTFASHEKPWGWDHGELGELGPELELFDNFDRDPVKRNPGMGLAYLESLVSKPLGFLKPSVFTLW